MTVGVLTAAHLLAAGAIWVCVLPLPVRGMLLVLLTVSLGYYWWRHAEPDSAGFMRRLVLLDDGQAEIVSGKGVTRQGRLLAWYWHPRVVVLTFATGRWRRQAIVVTAANAGVEPLRQLRLRLRMQAAPTMADNHA